MARIVEIIKVGNSSGLILPNELMQKLNLALGDAISLSETPEGLLLTQASVKKTRQHDLARKIARENSNMLKKLAE